MEKIERKINISDDLNFNFFQIWETSYNVKNERKLKKLYKSSPRYEKLFQRVRDDGSLLGITSVDS